MWSAKQVAAFTRIPFSSSFPISSSPPHRPFYTFVSTSFHANPKSPTFNNIKTIFFFFFFISCASKLRKPSWKRCLRKQHLLCTRLLHICIIIATFRLECEDDNEYEVSVLNKRLGFGGRKFSKCACSELKTRNCSRPRTQLRRSVHLSLQLCF